MNQPQEYRILHTEGDEIRDNGTLWANSIEELQADFHNPNWAIIPVGEVPENWRDMTIVDGALVLAAAEVIAAREVVRSIAEAEAVRQARAAMYATTTDQLMFDAIEAFAIAHPEDAAFTAWLTAKALIRTAHPKTPNEDVL